MVVGGGGAGLLDLLSEEKGKGKDPSYAVIHQEPDGSTIYRPFTSLPAPEAVVKIPGNQNPVAKNDRDKNIEIFPQ